MLPDCHGRSCLVLHAVIEALQALVLRPEVDLRLRIVVEWGWVGIMYGRASYAKF